MYITRRTQYVEIDGVPSDQIEISSGVPQGTVLGPALFSIYINDLFTIPFNTNIVGFADDAKIFGTPGAALQADIDSVSKWAKTNEMTLNSGKCHVIHLGRSNPHIVYYIDDNQLFVETEIRDLGIIVDETLSFRPHCLYIKKKCYRLINLMFRAFHTRDTHFYLRLYTTYITPIAEYSGFLYALNSTANTNTLEKINKYFSKRLWCRVNMTQNAPTYNIRLSKFGLMSLERRFLTQDLILLFKVLRGVVSSSGFAVRFSTLRSHRIVLDAVKTSRFRNYFLHRTQLLWNKTIHDTSYLTMSLKQYRKFVDSIDFSAVFHGSALKAH